MFFFYHGPFHLLLLLFNANCQPPSDRFDGHLFTSVSYTFFVSDARQNQPEPASIEAEPLTWLGSVTAESTSVALASVIREQFAEPAFAVYLPLFFFSLPPRFLVNWISLYSVVLCFSCPRHHYFSLAELVYGVDPVLGLSTNSPVRTPILKLLNSQQCQPSVWENTKRKVADIIRKEVLFSPWRFPAPVISLCITPQTKIPVDMVLRTVVKVIVVLLACKSYVRGTPISLTMANLFFLK